MRWVRPKVYILARPQIDYVEAQNWLDDMGVKNFHPSVIPSPPETLVQLAGKRCYMSFEVGQNPNIRQVRDDIADYIENILSIGHGSVIEHASYTFAIENVSRVFTGEMNRHRAGVAVSEGSMRFIRYEDIPIVEVPSLRGGDKITTLARRHIELAVREVEANYSAMQDIHRDELDGKSFAEKKKLTSMMRRIIPMGVATGGVWTLNLRALRHVFTMRCSEHAEEEICEVATMMLLRMMEEEPNFFGDFYRDESGFWKPKYEKV